MKSTNPAFGRNAFSSVRDFSEQRMTITGTVNKSFFLLSLVFLAAIWSWQESLKMAANSYPLSRSEGAFPLILMIGAIGGFAVGLLTVFIKKISPYTSPLYAVLQGVVLGAVSASFEKAYGGIVFQSVVGTLGTFLFMLFAYRSNMIRATEGFKKGMMAALGGLFFVYLISFILGFFGKTIPYIHQSGLIGIGFSVFVVCIAAFSFILDFDCIEQGAREGAPKYMEWYGAFGLLVTLIWLYLEILRLLAKLRDRK